MWYDAAMAKRFARNIEDFACVACGRLVEGDGYTNHCPACLTSLHVDSNPGDRAAGCGGIMRPVGLETAGGKRSIVFRCEKCGVVRRCRASPGDSEAALIALSAGRLRLG